MGAYIINIPDSVDRVIYTNVDPMNGKTYIASYSVDDFTPYTVPDFEQIEADAFNDGYKAGREVEKIRQKTEPHTAYWNEYKRGYEQGRKDGKIEGRAEMWEVARKIGCESMYGLHNIMHNLTASEAIEKIRQYEQEKEEQITKGDVVLIRSTPEIEILVTHADGEYVTGIALTEVGGYCKIGDQYLDVKISDVEKTGKHYDIVSVLQEMRENNG